jgi:hypothetical protein
MAPISKLATFIYLAFWAIMKHKYYAAMSTLRTLVIFKPLNIGWLFYLDFIVTVTFYINLLEISCTFSINQASAFP